MTGLEEETAEDKKPREGRLARNLEAPAAFGLESDGREEEVSMETERKENPRWQVRIERKG